MTRKSFTRSHNYEIQLWTASDSEKSSSSDVIQREQSTHKSFKTGYIFSVTHRLGWFTLLCFPDLVPSQNFVVCQQQSAD